MLLFLGSESKNKMSGDDFIKNQILLWDMAWDYPYGKVFKILNTKLFDKNGIRAFPNQETLENRRLIPNLR